MPASTVPSSCVTSQRRHGLQSSKTKKITSNMPASTFSRATSQHTGRSLILIGKPPSKKRPTTKTDEASAAIKEASAALKDKNDGPVMKSNGLLNDVMRRRSQACRQMLPACNAKMKKYPACQQMVEQLGFAFASDCSDWERRDTLIVAILEILIIIGKDRHSYTKYQHIRERASVAADYAMSTKEDEEDDHQQAFVRVSQLASDQARIVDSELEPKRRKHHYARIID